MRAISLWQPWASLVAIGAKRIETRSWATPYRGPLAIHAAKRWTEEEKETCLDQPFISVLAEAGFFEPVNLKVVRSTLPLGAIVATCQLVTILATDNLDWRADGIQAGHVKILTPPHEQDFGDYSPGRFAWVLGDIWRLSKPIPCRGQRSLWDLEAEIVEQITAQLGQAVTR